MEKQGDPLFQIRIFYFLSEHYAPLSTKLESYLASERDQYESQGEALKDERLSFAISNLYPNTVRYSMFIMLYQQFELTLTNVCLELEKDYPNSKKMSDLPKKDKGVTRACTYLKTVAGMHEPFEPSSWSMIKDLNNLRNFIVHNDAMIKADRMSHMTKVVAGINQWAPVSLNGARIFLSKTFLRPTSSFLCEQAEQLGQKLISAGWQ
jgi:hypothetical protein